MHQLASQAYCTRILRAAGGRAAEEDAALAGVQSQALACGRCRPLECSPGAVAGTPDANSSPLRATQPQGTAAACRRCLLLLTLSTHPSPPSTAPAMSSKLVKQQLSAILQGRIDKKQEQQAAQQHKKKGGGTKAASQQQQRGTKAARRRQQRAKRAAGGALQDEEEAATRVLAANLSYYAKTTAASGAAAGLVAEVRRVGSACGGPVDAALVLQLLLTALTLLPCPLAHSLTQVLKRKGFEPRQQRAAQEQAAAAEDDLEDDLAEFGDLL